MNDNEWLQVLGLGFARTTAGLRAALSPAGRALLFGRVRDAVAAEGEVLAAAQASRAAAAGIRAWLAGSAHARALLGRWQAVRAAPGARTLAAQQAEIAADLWPVLIAALPQYAEFESVGRPMVLDAVAGALDAVPAEALPPPSSRVEPDSFWAALADLCLPGEGERFGRDDLAAVLAALQALVPMADEGMEQRRALPGEVCPELRGAAVILDEELLQALVEGAPAPAARQWDALRAEAAAYLAQVIEEEAGRRKAAKKKRKRVRVRSREAHALDALDALHGVDFAAGIGTSATAEAERAWLKEMLAEVALSAFAAGHAARAVQFKPVEPLAVSGRKQRDGAVQAGRASKGKVKASTKAMLAEVKKLRDEGKSVSDAARLAKGRGFGTSAEANRRAWYDHEAKAAKE